jgi:hypothetical protein
VVAVQEATQAAANMLYAAAVLRLRPNEEWMGAALDCLEHHAQRVTAAAAAAGGAAVATVAGSKDRWDRGNERAPVMRQAVKQPLPLQPLEPQHIANALWACERLGFYPGERSYYGWWGVVQGPQLHCSVVANPGHWFGFHQPMAGLVRVLALIPMRWNIM